MVTFVHITLPKGETAGLIWINNDGLAPVRAPAALPIDMVHRGPRASTMPETMMNMSTARRLAIRLMALAVLAQAHPALATTRADTQPERGSAASLPARTIVPVSKVPVATVAARGSKPLHTASGVAPGQAGYVHYFLLRMPDDTLEVQVGIELADQRIAWSFPSLGVAISPFIDGEAMQAGGQSYEVWHLYGIRPFPDDAAMARLQKALPGRIAPWVQAELPYCLDDGPGSKCMSCLGFVLRALFPGRGSDYPGMPRDFWYSGAASKYTPNDLLLYLTGMQDLPNRDARRQRLAKLELPADLRADLEELIYAMGAGNAAAPPRAAVPLTTRQKRGAAPPPPRRKL